MSWATGSMASLGINPSNYWVCLWTILHTSAKLILQCLQSNPSMFDAAQIKETLSDIWYGQLIENFTSDQDILTAKSFKEWRGTTRSSWSAVNSMVAGYCTPGVCSHGRRTLCSGEYLHRASSSCIIFKFKFFWMNVWAKSLTQSTNFDSTWADVNQHRLWKPSRQPQFFT